MDDNEKRLAAMRELIAATQRGDKKTVERIKWSIKVHDWALHMAGKRQRQEGDEKYFEGVFLYLLKRYNQVKN